MATPGRPARPEPALPAVLAIVAVVAIIAVLITLRPAGAVAPVASGPGASAPGGRPGTSPTGSSSAFPSAHAGDPILVVAGDVGGSPPGRAGGDEATALLLDAIVAASPGRVTIAAAGDLAYESGTSTEFAERYDPTWGRHKAITTPTPGNHEYRTRGAAGYFAYFGAAAGDPGQGYYAYDLGAWRIYALNSEIAHESGSAQVGWLRADLAAHPTECALAFTHRPRFSSGSHGSDTGMRPIWQTLVDGGVEIMVAGHDHNYQRFVPQTAAGVADPARGVRQWVVGTGGVGSYAFDRPIANVEAYDTQTLGVLELTLHPAGYDFRFVPVAGGTFKDAGTNVPCH